MPDLLYHYCSVQTFLQIIANRTIRVSDNGKMNDYLENSYASTFIVGEILKLIQEFKIDLIYGVDGGKLLLFKEYMSNIIDNVFVHNMPKTITYVACFSEDGDVLSQWRGYADNGCGVSLGFDKGLLSEFDEWKLSF